MNLVIGGASSIITFLLYVTGTSVVGSRLRYSGTYININNYHGNMEVLNLLRAYVPFWQIYALRPYWIGNFGAALDTVLANPSSLRTELATRP